MKIVQVHLANTLGDERLTTWVDWRPDLKEGGTIRLKDFMPDTYWTITKLYDKTHDARDFDFHRKWDNNNYDKHKGLGV